MQLAIQLSFWALLLLVTASAVYQLLCLYSAWLFFRSSSVPSATAFAPPVTVLKPLRGAEEWLHETLASFCTQDYPNYEIIFGVRDATDPAIDVVKRLRAAYPQTTIKLVINPTAIGTSAKVSNLHNLLQEAQHELLVISDCDARVTPDYLRTVVAPLSDARVGLVTCLYRPIGSHNFAALMEGLGLMGEFAQGVLVARWLDGVKFAFGATAATRRSVITQFGGFAAIADRLGDDFLLGNLTAQAGYEVILSPYVVETVIPPYRFAEMFRHQLRWARSTKFRRPLAYVGLLFTHTTALSLAALLAFPESALIWAVSVAALVLRLLAAWLIGVRGFADRRLRRYFYLLPLRDLLSFMVWIVSFCGNTVYWCGDRYRLQPGGKLQLSKR
jgi:ceramide glucosyltransferase